MYTYTNLSPQQILYAELYPLSTQHLSWSGLSSQLYSLPTETKFAKIKQKTSVLVR